MHDPFPGAVVRCTPAGSAIRKGSVEPPNPRNVQPTWSPHGAGQGATADPRPAVRRLCDDRPGDTTISAQQAASPNKGRHRVPVAALCGRDQLRQPASERQRRIARTHRSFIQRRHGHRNTVPVSRADERKQSTICPDDSPFARRECTYQPDAAKRCVSDAPTARVHRRHWHAPAGCAH